MPTVEDVRCLAFSLAHTDARRCGELRQRRFCARLIFSFVDSGIVSPLFQGLRLRLIGTAWEVIPSCREHNASVRGTHYVALA